MAFVVESTLFYNVHYKSMFSHSIPQFHKIVHNESLLFWLVSSASLPLLASVLLSNIRTFARATPLPTFIASHAKGNFTLMSPFE